MSDFLPILHVNYFTDTVCFQTGLLLMSIFSVIFVITISLDCHIIGLFIIFHVICCNICNQYNKKKNKQKKKTHTHTHAHKNTKKNKQKQTNKQKNVIPTTGITYSFWITAPSLLCLSFSVCYLILHMILILRLHRPFF